MLSSPDTLRQRVTLALSEIMVASVSGFNGGWKAFSAAAYLDLLEGQAFGNYRTLLQQVSTSAPMGEYLTFRGNVKFNATTGALPDENYAREVMQLFTIGLLQLNLDGTPKLAGGAPQETYTLDDITGLARVFTGWNYDLAGGDTNTPDYKRRPMTMTASRHETGSKTFLGTTIPAGTSGEDSLRIALDAIFAHANVAPFIGRQLILRLVVQQPEPGLRHARGDGLQQRRRRRQGQPEGGGQGDPAGRRSAQRGAPGRSRIRQTARTDPAAGGMGARVQGRRRPNDTWTVGNTSDPATRLGQSPLRSSSVFNFFRPGYVPPNSAIGSAGLVAPEFQITNESSVVGYVNFMQSVVSKGAGDVKADYAQPAAAGRQRAGAARRTEPGAGGRAVVRRHAGADERRDRHAVVRHRCGAPEPDLRGAGAGAGRARIHHPEIRNRHAQQT